MLIKVPELDISEAGGGLRRMMDRYLTEGTLTGHIEEDIFLSEHPAAALLGLLYDQRVRADMPSWVRRGFMIESDIWILPVLQAWN